MPWKNGRGVTRELVTDATPLQESWSWRLSCADLPDLAEFSLFPGIDRSILVLRGDGMQMARGRLSVATAIDRSSFSWQSVPNHGDAFQFAGEEPWIGDPLGHGVEDINLMVDRQQWRATLSVARGESAHEVHADLIIMYAASREVTIRAATLEGDLNMNEGFLAVLSGPTVHYTTSAHSQTVVAQLHRR